MEIPTLSQLASETLSQRVPTLKQLAAENITQHMRSLLVNKRRVSRQIELLRANPERTDETRARLRSSIQALRMIDRNINTIRNDPRVPHFIEQGVLPFDMFYQPLTVLTTDDFI